MNKIRAESVLVSCLLDVEYLEKEGGDSRERRTSFIKGRLRLWVSSAKYRGLELGVSRSAEFGSVGLGKQENGRRRRWKETSQ